MAVSSSVFPSTLVSSVVDGRFSDFGARPRVEKPASASFPRGGAAPRISGLSSALIFRFPPNFVRQLSTKARRNCSNIGVAQIVAASNSSPSFEPPRSAASADAVGAPEAPSEDAVGNGVLQSRFVDSPVPAVGEEKLSPTAPKDAASLSSDGSLAVHAGERFGRGTRTDAITTPVVNTSGYWFNNSDELIDLKVEALLDNVKWDSKGLAVAIAQNVDTGAILMQGFANREALSVTISSRKATFYSRSRSSLWTKGETSMNFINVHDIFLDCDRDSILYLGVPDGPTCHTGADTCYYSSVYDILDDPEFKEGRQASTTLYSLEATISQRKAEIDSMRNGKPSWTKKLLLDTELLCSKIREESGELVQTLLENEDKTRTASEMADLLYHAMVLLKLKDVKVDEVFQVLRKRFSKSGIEEKNSRKSPSNQS